MNTEKILEEIDKLKRDCLLSEFENGYVAGAVDMANAIKDVICANKDDGKDTNVHGNDDYVMFTINEDGVAEDYDDTYDVTIHCEFENEQKRVIGMLERYQEWIPVEERLPEDCEKMVLVQVSGKVTENIWFDNAFELATYVNGEGWILENYPEWKDPKVIAWKPLPEPYRPKEKNNE